MTAANRQRAGFSLVELLIVVSLMAVLAGAIIPHMQPDVVSQLTNLAHILVVDLGYAQNLAITKRQPLPDYFRYVEWPVYAGAQR